MPLELTEGALASIMAGGQVDSPVMQILGSKKISGAGDNERYRLLVSDGQYVNSFAMLATQLNDKIRSGELSDNTIVLIKRFITSLVPNSGRGEKRVMIILDVEVLAPGHEVGGKIGDPQTFNADGQVPSRPVEAPAPAPQAPPRPSPQAAPPSVPVQERQPFRSSPVKPTSSNHSDFGGGYGDNIRSPNQNKGMGGLEITPNMNTHPITSLTPYQNKWIIKARVTFKSPIRTWSNKNGEGKLFSFDLIDETGEIRVTAFKAECDKFFDLIEVNKVYMIHRGQLKAANKRFTTLNNDYEMSLTSDTQIIPVLEDDTELPQIRFNFVKLKEVEGSAPNTMIDVIGVVTNTGEIFQFTSKQSNKDFKKREVAIVDDSEVCVNVTFWGEQAESFDGSNNPIIAVKGGKVNEFGGAKTVSFAHNSVLQVNPDIPEAHQLRGWYDSTGSKDFKSLSARVGGTGSYGDGNLITLKEARSQGLGNADKADYFSCKATVLLVKHENSLYKACVGENCLKKVLDQNNGLYRCEKCNQDYPSFTPRLLLSMSIGDWCDHAWVTLFQESAETLLGYTAQELHEFKENNDERFLQAFQQATFKSYQLRIRVVAQNYNDEKRIRMTVVNVKPVDHVAYSKSLLTQLSEMVGMGSVKQ